MKTWMYEIALLVLVLSGVTLMVANNLINWITTAAIILTFNHAQIADRLQERQRILEKPNVECYHKLNKLFVLKEIMWISAFVLMGAYSAIIGSAMFALYPFWRKYYRKNIKPL